MNSDLKAKLQTANEHYEALLRDERDRETYRLASSIVDRLDPQLEKPGEEKLRQIVEWMMDKRLASGQR